MDPSRLIWILAIIKAGLWLAAGLVSALLVYWLHFKPVYEEDWTATIGSVVCAGLATGDIRGLLKHGPDGKLERPDLVVCDDPQTDESARMPGQCNTREAVLNETAMMEF